MAYSIIQPPFTLKFSEMSKRELKDYYKWFLEVLPQRIDELTNAVRESPGFENWEPNESPASLDPLGEWFASQVEMRPRTEEEMREIEGRSSFPIEIPKRELTNRTFSLAMDIAMYFSRIFVRNHHPTVRWDQKFGGKRWVDYGQPVLVGFGPVVLNPVRLMVTLAYSLADKTRTGGGLREIYDIWSDNIQESGGSKGGGRVTSHN